MKPDYVEREFRPREPQSRGNKVVTSLDESVWLTTGDRNDQKGQ